MELARFSLPSPLVGQNNRSRLLGGLKLLVMLPRLPGRMGLPPLKLSRLLGRLVDAINNGHSTRPLALSLRRCELGLPAPALRLLLWFRKLLLLIGSREDARCIEDDMGVPARDDSDGIESSSAQKPGIIPPPKKPPIEAVTCAAAEAFFIPLMAD